MSAARRIDEDRIVIHQMVDDIIADDIAQSISIPIPPIQERLLPPRARIASGLRAHPAGFALLIPGCRTRVGLTAQVLEKSKQPHVGEAISGAAYR